ncbi:uncharacterized protein [Enoplosus armatus]|uniref:uncharacterized protein n=1 Tax=Enoplosus armatus TaxID=215367 RepID=UPI00399536BB
MPDPTCMWITDFLYDRKQHMKLGKQHRLPSRLRSFSSPLLPVHQQLHLQSPVRQAPEVGGRISGEDESAYRWEIDHLMTGCNSNNLEKWTLWSPSVSWAPSSARTSSGSRTSAPSSRKPNRGYEENSCEQYSDFCETHTLSAPLGSSVLLRCDFSPSSSNWVSWVHTPGLDLVHLTSEGRIKFLDHRYGRLKAFPNQGSEGNYSISIDDLKNSDLGCYRCKQDLDCLQVELVAETGAPSDDKMLLIYICVGGATFILLSVSVYCCVKYISCCDNRAQVNMNNPVGAGIEGVSAPPVETGRVQRAGEDNLVYENDDQDPANQQGDATRIHRSPPGVLPDVDRTQPTQSIYPNLNQSNFESLEIQQTKQRFHTELFSRLRQASLSRHYYVNRGEFSKQHAASTQAENHRRGGNNKKKAKDNCDYKNPIYNRSTDHLNQP